MKITFISDTHNRHDLVKIEPTDILIHSGDMTSHGSIWKLQDFYIGLVINQQTPKS
jgi:predicted phosphodiesterase